jgi:phosphatidylglycerol:prolipoprotein diacylglycerol transferase
MFIWSVDPIAFQVFGLPIYWYGIIYGFSLASAWAVTTFVLRKLRAAGITQIPSKELFDQFMLFAIIFMLVGARLGHVLFFDFEYYCDNPLEIPMIRKGGLSFHGGAIALAVYIYFFNKRRGLSWKIMMDALCIGSSLGLGIGRIANFFNQELYGKVCTLDFAVIFPMVDNMPRYPTQLFESIFEGFINFWILIVTFRISGTKVIGNCKIPAIFAIVYSSSRFIIEFYKDVEVCTYFNCISLTVGQTLSIALFIFGIFLFSLNERRKSS